MKIIFNGKSIDSDAKTLFLFLSEQGFTADSNVATAVNGQFIPKTMRENHRLADGDSVEVVAPMQGG